MKITREWLEAQHRFHVQCGGRLHWKPAQRAVCARCNEQALTQDEATDAPDFATRKSLQRVGRRRRG